MGNKKYIISLDQGTTSTRAIIFNLNGEIISISQREHSQIFSNPGWVEHDPMEIWRNTRAVIADALVSHDLHASDISCMGITNQRESVMVWDRDTGKPIYNVITWQDTRTKNICNLLASGNPNKYRHKTGLPISTYFSGPKLVWILENIKGAREGCESGRYICGTMDTWIVWNLTNGTQHVTDVTNASRTMLMDIKTCEWDKEICSDLDIPIDMLPVIKPSSGSIANIRSKDVLSGIPILSILGDQQAALFGQVCFNVGDIKNTYGTGNFVLINTGEECIFSKNGLLTSIGFQIEKQPPIYVLEGSIAVTGSAIQWLRDNLGIISNANEVESLIALVENNGGCYFVPAFSGLFAPYWSDTARGSIVGLTRYVNKSHIARAALEATAYQVKDVIDVMCTDIGKKIQSIKVDGGMVVNEFLMQFQSDILGIPLVSQNIVETTALGAAYSAGLALGIWNSTNDILSSWKVHKSWVPKMDKKERDYLYNYWKKAVELSIGWI